MGCKNDLTVERYAYGQQRIGSPPAISVGLNLNLISISSPALACNPVIHASNTNPRSVYVVCMLVL